ncbi:MAG: hypothetical protein RL456_977 [Pseudomonadota bacterium]|jgi:glycosyltransferase involved in cell wall biosynthesis
MSIQPSPDDRPAGLAYLVSRYPAVSHTFILREVLGLRRLGLAVDVASVNPPDRTPERMTDDERAELARVYGLKPDGVAGALHGCAWALAHRPLAFARTLADAWGLGRGLGRVYALAYGVEAAMVARWMAGLGHRHLHVHFGTVGSTVGLLVRRLTGCGLSVTIHGPDEFDDVSAHHLVRKMVDADRIVCISQFARSQLMRLSPPATWPKMAVCRLGVDVRHFAPDAPPPSVRDPQGPVRLLSVGRLAPAKGQLLMIEALGRLHREGVAFEMTVVGDGPDRARLEEEAARQRLGGRVRFTGSLNQAEVHALLREADAFVLPSLAEGIPVVLMEAMASGVPCVTTPVNGIPELVRHEVNGLLATPGDVDALTAELRRMVADPALRARLREAALAQVAQSFHHERNVAALAEILRALPEVGRRGEAAAHPGARPVSA